MAVNVNGIKISYGMPAAALLPLDRAPGGQVPRMASQPPVTSSSPAGLVILAYLRTRTEGMRSLDPMVRRDEPDAVHRMRVTTRQLRSTLRSFRHILHREGTRRLAALDSDRYLSLLDDLDWLLDDPPFTAQAAMPAAEVLPAAARHPWQQADRQMHRARSVAAGQLRDEALHQARKAARRGRYASEAMAQAVGKEAGRFTKQMKKAQSVLGEHQDAVITRQVARELGISAHLTGENAFSYGLLYERDVCHGQRLQVEAQQAWKRASRPGYLHWMR